MALRLEFPLLSCNSLSHLLKRRPNTVLLYLSEDCSSPVIPESVWLPLTALKDPDDFFSRLSALDSTEAVVCYEETGVTQAAAAWWLLVSRGHRLVYVLEGGLLRWSRNSGPAWGNSPDSAALKAFAEPLLPKPMTESQQQVSTDPDKGAKLYMDSALLLSGADLAEPKVLKWVLTQAGVRLDDVCETIVYGSKAQLLLLVLCSLGKNNLRLGVDIPLGEQLYGEEDEFSTGRKRQLSNLSEPELLQSTRSSIQIDPFAQSSPASGLRQACPLQRKRTKDFSGGASCRSCLLQ